MLCPKFGIVAMYIYLANIKLSKCVHNFSPNKISFGQNKIFQMWSDIRERFKKDSHGEIQLKGWAYIIKADHLESSAEKLSGRNQNSPGNIEFIWTVLKFELGEPQKNFLWQT